MHGRITDAGRGEVHVPANKAYAGQSLPSLSFVLLKAYHYTTSQAHDSHGGPSLGASVGYSKFEAHTPLGRLKHFFGNTHSTKKYYPF